MKQSKKQNKKQNFSSFTLSQAYQHLGLVMLKPWAIDFVPKEPSQFFLQRLDRLQQTFDLRAYEKSKELLIDAVCEEALYPNSALKIWKGAALSSDDLTGNVDYLMTDRKDYLDRPYLCIVEAKKDDFEQGLAQCLVEMAACLWNNRQVGQEIPVFGIVTNGETWRFYRLDPDQQVYESAPYAIGSWPIVLGCLHRVFQWCLAHSQGAIGEG
ncbi:hypothetical protein H6G51_14840 [Limnothrix sp. FACHB-708]|uniref:hypothetical protein n=1 Tax=unclassified Limnothrix TaxID=2632864 RepID=UPI0016802A28|nr:MULTISPECIES: hypothetical protein [unclassified Limnothrix]MBD2161689.1 hypothetical protein [Limnothrix sp. FACHB-1083]MBD2192734.1 hypothetical protein [Limnothrix sp. FACHB-1088]MBD2554562.1 hypothetical protein [Limnothrix sp. FACHB-708]MBD2591588.1 hypothetical protein [Limnothrix sp. FACHB-406]